MYEIELKAHVNNYNNTKNIISSFATFLGTKQKSDVYWQCFSEKLQAPVRVRIREETCTNSENKESTELIVTYKKKELRTSSDLNKHIDFEVNEEHEFCINERKAFEAILIDTGYEVDLVKEKKVEQWEYDGVLLELCTILNLGDFLELEIIAHDQDKETVHEALKKLQSVLLKCNIPLENIEKRYYSELLREKDI